MKYFKLINSGVIVQIGSGSRVHESQVEITKEEYDNLMMVIQSRPVNTLESVFYLSETGEYVGRERTEEEIIDWYQDKVKAGEMELTEVPEEYQDKIVIEETTEEVDQYQAGYDAAVLDLIEAGVL